MLKKLMNIYRKISHVIHTRRLAKFTLVLTYYNIQFLSFFCRQRTCFSSSFDCFFRKILYFGFGIGKHNQEWADIAGSQLI